MPVPLLPDPVALVISALGAQAAVTTLSPRIYSRIPGSAVFPLYVVSSVDEDEAGDPVLGLSREQVDCWGGGNGAEFDQQARLMARTVRSVARDLKGAYAAGTIVDCAPELIIPGPDSDTGRARFIIDLIVRAGP